MQLIRDSFTAFVIVLAVVTTSRHASARPQEPTVPEEPPASESPSTPAEPPPAPQEPPAPEASEPTAHRERKLDVHVDAELGGYADSDHVLVLSPTIAGTVTDPVAGWSAGGRYLVDMVSAASVDIVATASRRYTELRHVGSVDASYKPHDFGVSATASISSEPDYLSLTAGGAVTMDLLEKNLTLLLGFSHGHDIAGRTGTSFSTFSRSLDIEAFKGGATVLVDRSTVLSLIGDVRVERGDPSKPYRYIPLFAPGTAVPLGASIADVNRLRLSARALEQLPTSRDRLSLSGLLAHRFESSTLRVEERLYADTWGLTATTTDARLILDIGGGRRFDIGPRVRFHGQTPVDFWQRAYTMGPGLDFPALRTGDRELGPLVNVTGGGMFRWGLGSSETPRSWVLGFDASATTTHYLDDIYLKERLSTVLTVSLEADL